MLLHPVSCGFPQWASRFSGRLAVVAALLGTWFVVMTTVGAIPANAGVGELGPPPVDLEIKQVLTDLYNAGHPPDSSIDVQFVGPILVGQPTVHPNPPPRPQVVQRNETPTAETRS